MNESTRRLRLKLIARLGSKCVRCPETDVRVLQFDHVNGRGADHRRSVSGPHAVLCDIRDSLDRGEHAYQLLCSNCNWKKRLTEDPKPERVGRQAGFLVGNETKDKIARRMVIAWQRPDERAERTAAVQAAWERKTAEDLAAHGAKVSAGKIAAGNKGSVENLAKGWAVRDKAIAASADARRGTHETKEHRTKIADGLKRAYAEGRRTRGHSEETRRKISESKAGKGPTIAQVWARRVPPHCTACQETTRPHKGRGVCLRCYPRMRTATHKSS